MAQDNLCLEIIIESNLYGKASIESFSHKNLCKSKTFVNNTFKIYIFFKIVMDLYQNELKVGGELGTSS